MARRLVLLLSTLALLVVFTQPAQAAVTYWWADLTHYAYRFNQYADNSSSNVLAKATYLHNGSGNTQLFEVYGKNTSGQYVMLLGGQWLNPGQSAPVADLLPWQVYSNWKIAISDGHFCTFRNRP